MLFSLSTIILFLKRRQTRRRFCASPQSQYYGTDDVDFLCLIIAHTRADGIAGRFSAYITVPGIRNDTIEMIQVVTRRKERRNSFQGWFTSNWSGSRSIVSLRRFWGRFSNFIFTERDLDQLQNRALNEGISQQKCIKSVPEVFALGPRSGEWRNKFISRTCNTLNSIIIPSLMIIPRP